MEQINAIVATCNVCVVTIRRLQTLSREKRTSGSSGEQPEP